MISELNDSHATLLVTLVMFSLATTFDYYKALLKLSKRLPMHPVAFAGTPWVKKLVYIFTILNVVNKVV